MTTNPDPASPPSIENQKSKIENPPDLPLTTDLPCAQCHYNLRTKKPSELCPECAHPVSHSIAWNSSAGPHNPGFAALGALLIAVWSSSGLLRWLLYIGLRQFGETLYDNLMLPIQFIAFLLSVATCAGIFLLRHGAAPARPLPSLKYRLFVGLVALDLIIIPLAILIYVSVQNWTFFTPGSTSVSLVIIVILVAIPILNAILFFIGWRYMRRLARRLNLRGIAWATFLLYPTYITCLLLPTLQIPFYFWGQLLLWNWMSILLVIVSFVEYAKLALDLAFILYWLRLAYLFHKTPPSPTTPPHDQSALTGPLPL